MRQLDNLGSWRLQMGIYRFALLGNVLEHDAVLAEFGQPFDVEPFWDRSLP